MKILVLTSHTPSLFWFRKDMMLDFLALGHTVVAVGNETEEVWQERFAEFGVAYRQAYVQRNGTNPLKDLKTLKSFRKLIKEEKPDRIFAYQAKSVIYGGLAAKKERVDTYSLIGGVGSVLLSKGLKASLIKAVLKTEYRMALKTAKKVFFQNPDDVKVFLDNKLLKQEQVVMLNGSGVNLERFTCQPLPEKPAFLCISRLIRDKGVVEYLQAAKRVKQLYPNVRFLLVGPFDSNPSAITKQELQPYIDAGIIEYFGEQEDVRPYFMQSSVFVLPSYSEGTPKTVLEAMACGKAIITTDAPGCRETVVNNENGLLIPVKNVDALEKAMCFMIENPQEVERFALAGRNLAEEKFDVRKVNKTIIQTMGL